MKNSKKVLAILASMALSVGVFAGCSSSDSSSASVKESTAGTTATSSSDDYKIALITMDQMDQHWVNLNNGAQEEAEKLGVTVDWLAPNTKNDAEQIEKVNNAVANGAQAIIVAANGPDAISSALETAKDSGVEIVYVDSPASVEAYQTIGTDNEAAGKTAGETMLAEFKEAGITEGKIGVISVNASTDSTVQRDEGFRSAFEGTKFEVLETQFSDGDALRAQSMATSFITEGVVGLYGTNEGCTVGVGNAIQEAGDSSTIIGIGFDKSDVALQLVSEGHIKAIMVQNPETMGQKGVEAAVNALKGVKATESYVDTGVTVVTVENASEFQ